MYLPIDQTKLIKASKTAQQRIAMVDQGFCLGCLQLLNDEKPISGLHPKCHRATLRAIAAGKTTRDERVREGKMLPRGKAGRKPSNPVTIELS